MPFSRAWSPRTPSRFPSRFDSLTPLLRWSYTDGSGAWFSLVRNGFCLILVGVPAVMLGATFPISLRAFGIAPQEQAAVGSRLYASNTAGAAGGAIAAGFVLLPWVGVLRTTVVGATASILAAAIALHLQRLGGLAAGPTAVRRRGSRSHRAPVGAPASSQFWVAAVILSITGLVGLLYKVAWTRSVASLLGPTTYAFAGTVSVLISGLAIGGAVGGNPL